MAGKLLITPNSGSTTAGQDPTIKFQGTGNSSDITLRVTSTGALSFEGTSGQLFSVTDSMSGTIYSVNDISGIPSIEVLDTGLIKLAQYSGNIVLGSATDDGINKLQVTGPVSITGQLTSTVATGTAPFVVASTTLVPNLNADLHDGLQTATTNTASTVVARDASGNFSAGTITATLSGTATSVTTNANLTGPITSTGNATAIASQTGTGTKFVMDTSPVLVTPNIGIATGTSFNSITGLSATSPAMDGTATVGTGVTVARADHIHPSDTSKLSLSGGTMTGSIIVPTGQDITLTDQPVVGTDAANKNYVDAVAAGLTWKNSVNAATTANITLSGLQTVDGVSLVAGNRVLVKNQTSTSENGIYVVAAGGWTRAADMDATTPLNEFNGAGTLVTGGTTYDNTAWTVTSTVSVVGTDAVSWAQFNGAAGITAGTGLTLTGNTLSVNASQTQITAVGTLGSLTVTGTISGSNLSGTNTGDQTLPTALPNPNAITFNNSGTGAASGTTYTGSAVQTISYNTIGAQPLGADLTAIDGLAGTSGFLKKTAADTWTLDTTTYSTTNGTVTSVAAITLTTTGTDITSSVATGTTTPVITLNVPTASASVRGLLSSTDWTTFNNKQPAGSYQPLGADLTAIDGLAGTSGFLKKTATDTWTLDTTTYSTTNGTVTSVSVTTANGISGTVATNTTTPAITLTLGAITPSSVASAGTVSGTILTSNVAQGTAPLTVTSNTLVTNLNADMLDGLQSTAFATSSHTHGNITNVGAIGSTSGLPIITTAGGVLTAGSFGTGAGTFCAGDDARLATQTTVSGQAGFVANAVTFNNSGTGAASGTTFNGSAAQTISYNTIGAQVAGSYAAAGATTYVGTTAIALNRTSAAQALTGITSIDGYASILNTAGNYQVSKLGVGVAPTTGWSFTGSIDVGTSAAFTGNSSVLSAMMVANSYYNGTNWIYKNTGFTGRVIANSGGTGDIDFYVGPSGTAAGTVTEVNVLKVTAAGNLTVPGTVSASNFSGSSSGTNTGDNATNSNYASDYRAANFVAGTNYLAPSAVTYVGTTSIAHNRGSGAQTLTGISIDGSAAGVPWSGVTTKPTTVSGYGITDAVKGFPGQGASWDMNAMRNNPSGIYSWDTHVNGPAAVSYSQMLHMHERADTAAQLVIDYSTGNAYTRGIQTATPTYSAWNTLLHNNNYSTYTTFTAAITSTGNITAYYSDDRLKTRTGIIENALDKISTLDTFYYHANETAQALGYEPIPEVGISAQQVQAIMPQVVAPAPIDDKYLTVRYERLVPLLIAAIKEQQVQIEELKQLIKNK